MRSPPSFFIPSKHEGQAPSSLPFFSSVADNRKLNPEYFKRGERRMTREELERAIQFLIGRRATFSTDIEKLKETQERTSANLESLSESVSLLKARTETDRSDMRERSKILTEDMRNRLTLLILGDEVTRDLTEQVRLALGTPHK